MNTRSRNIIANYGIAIPDSKKLGQTVKIEKLADTIRYILNDNKGGAARADEVIVRYCFTGKVENVHPLGCPDVVVKRGVSVEVKTGHGWIIEPMFPSLDNLADYLDERKNLMFGASHVAYLPARATGEIGEEADFLVMTAKQFTDTLAKHGKMVAKQDRSGAWGVAMKPWITEGYAQKSSKTKEAEILMDFLEVGESVQEFAERMGIEFHNPKEAD